MTKRRQIVVLTGALMGSLFHSVVPASAATGLMLTPSVFAAASLWPSGDKSNCMNSRPSFAASAALFPDLPSKSQAILSGQESALERITRQQQSLSTALSTATPVGALVTEPTLSNANCLGLVQSFSVLPAVGPVLRDNQAPPEDFLASKRLLIKKTPLDRPWNRVRRGTVSRSYASTLVGAPANSASPATLSAVNAWTNRHVRYVEDQAIFGKKDYWADARATLRRRAGDCEDIAIAKMQLLAALGFDRSNMYLTIARDLVRNNDHAVLIVRMKGRNWLLDNSTDTVLDANASHDYRPIMSFSQSEAWLHGYTSLAANVR
jgi:predicted transglutaminase-like cysteine proteinase